MHLVEREAGELNFVLDENDSTQDQEFHAEMQNYRIMRQGASIFFYNANDELVLHFNPFDNTVLVCSPDGYALANRLGTKRFPISAARLALTKQQANEVGATKFKRDYSFPLQSPEQQTTSPYKVVALEDLLKIYDTKQLNTALAELFNRCNDFTPGKKAEYLKGGKLEDKYCRFNLENQQPKSGIVTDQVFLLDDKNKIIGTISFTLYVNKDRIIDIYLYDEIVDYFTILSEKDQQKLQSLYPDATLSDDAKQAALVATAHLIEPKRLALMAPLFEAARLRIIDIMGLIRSKESDSLDNLTDAIEKGRVHAFIRAAAGREESYLALNCSATNSATYVIHGPASKYANLLDSYVKQWAYRKLQQFAFHQYLEHTTSTIVKENAAELKSYFDQRLFAVKPAPVVQTTSVQERKINANRV
jgi:hypothetical protein